MSNQWSDNLRNRMEDHKEPSPEGLWNDIEQIMIEKKGTIIDNAPLKRKNIVLWDKRIASAAAIILFLLLIGYNGLRNDKGEAIMSLQELTQKEMSPDSKEFVDKSQTEKKLVANKYRQVRTNPHKEELHEINEPVRQNQKPENILVTNEEKENGQPLSEPEDKQPLKKRPDINIASPYDLDAIPNMNFQKVKKVKWETSLYASNISSGFTDRHSGYGSLALASPPVLGSDENLYPEEYLLQNILAKNIYEEVATDIKHKQPIVIGASFNYRLNERWSLTSGLTYTKLSSELRSGSNITYYYKEQNLHYIGIPLNVNYHIWQNKKLAVYISGGGLVEKNVSGEIRTNYVLDSKAESEQVEKISIDRLQWSVNSFLGIQYNFTRKIGIYAEPGASYYFKVRSDIETIYKEKPLSPSLRFGIRFSLNE